MTQQTSQKVKSTKLIDLYQQSQQELDQQVMYHEVELAKLQLQSDILATKQSLAKAEMDFTNSKIAIPFNAVNIINAKNNITALKAGLKELEALQEELF